MLTQQEKIDYLRKTDLFGNVVLEQLDRIVRAMTERKYAPHHVILREGEWGDALYFLVQGTVSVVKEDVPIMELGPGACIGEMALLDDSPRSATIMAVDEVIALRLGRKDFERILMAGTPILQGMYRILVQKIRTDLTTYVQTIQAQERINQDIRRAHEVQRSMLPRGDLNQSGVRIVGTCLTAESVGGDYFDYFPLPDGRIGVFIGDVTGHGFYAGFIVAMARSCLVTQIGMNPGVKPVLQALNRIVFSSGPEWVFMTGCYMVINPASRTIAYANAGHTLPFFYRARTGRLIRLPATSYPIGIESELEDRIPRRKYDPGDVLFLYSDGITEVENPAKKRFGVQRLAACIRECVHLPPEKIIQTVMDRVNDFIENKSAHDDITIVVIQFTGQATE